MQDDKERIRQNIAKMRSQGASDAEVEQYLQNVEGLKPQEPSRVGAKPSAAPADATRALSRSRPGVSGDFEAVAPAVAANLASMAQVIPGMEAVQAKASSLANDIPYGEALQTQRGETDAIPVPIKVAGRMVAAPAVMAAMPASAAASGAVLGAADQMLDADPKRGLGSRVLGGAAGAAVGGATGAVLDAAVTKARSLGAEPSSKVIQEFKRDRKAATSPLFDQAIKQGAGKTATDPDIAMFVSRPDIQEIINGLRDTRRFATVADDSPEMLDAIYKVLSDQGAAVKRGLEAPTPNRPNIGRYRGEDIRAAKDEALTAMDATMPSYRPAVQTYAEHSGNIDAVRRGQDAVRGGVSKGITTGKNLDRNTLEAFEDYMANATPEQRKAALKGLLGATKQAATGTTPLRAISTLARVPAYLRATKTPEQQAFDALIKATLLSGAAVNPF